MKFTCERSFLLKEISIAQEIISSKKNILILSNVCLEIKNNYLYIKATDLQVNFETKVPIEVKEEGSTTVSGEKFLSILNSLPEGEIEFEQKNNIIIIKPLDRKITFQLRCIDSDKFPEFPAFSKERYFELPIKDFKDMIIQTAFAVS
ncbi:MAG: DNA polymerase III subunit beta, partial [Treponema sp.]|nr:DNA polymerase III subunit beta [Treponema sp.]